MAAFGDADPEDAWDEGDKLSVKVSVLDRWVASVQLERLSEGPTARVILRKEMALAAVLKILLEHLALGVRKHLGQLREALENLP